MCGARPAVDRAPSAIKTPRDPFVRFAWARPSYLDVDATLAALPHAGTEDDVQARVGHQPRAIIEVYRNTPEANQPAIGAEGRNDQVKLAARVRG